MASNLYIGPKRNYIIISLIITLLLPCILSFAEEPSKRFNIPLPTMGGKQYWSDVTLYGGWRIQQNVFTEHYRLLSPWGIRRAWGNLEQCTHTLEQAKKDGRAKLSSDKVCVLIHGYWRSKDSLKGLRKGLKNAGYEVYAINYPSSRLEMDTLAEQIRSILKDIRGDFKKVDVVTHSMGGIVVRNILSGDDSPDVNRLVMIAPPNQGAILADMLLSWWPSERIAGPAGKQMMTDIESYTKIAGIPKCDFGIIAATRGDGKGWNPLIPGEDDGVVGVENTRLEGMKDHIILHGMHTTIMNDIESIRQTLAFMETGKFSHDAKEETTP